MAADATVEKAMYADVVVCRRVRRAGRFAGKVSKHVMYPVYASVTVSRWRINESGESVRVRRRMTDWTYWIVGFPGTQAQAERLAHRVADQLAAGEEPEMKATHEMLPRV